MATDLSKLFGDAALEALTQTNLSDRRQESRLILGVTLDFPDGPFVANKLYDRIANSPGILDVVLLESLTPLPIATVLIRDDNAEQETRNVLEYFRRFDGCRIVCGIGEVEVGTIGGSEFIAVGSVGPVVSAVVEGCFVLPRGSSWCNQAVAEKLNFAPSTPIRVFGHKFIQIPVGK